MLSPDVEGRKSNAALLADAATVAIAIGGGLAAIPATGSVNIAFPLAAGWR
jgi:hypothetical protein